MFSSMNLTKWKRITILVSLLFASAMTAVSLFNIYAPTCDLPLSVESLVRKSIIYSALIVGNIFVITTFFLRTKVNFICTSIVALFIVLSIFTSAQREFKLERLYWEIDGVVSKKYRSNNHGAKTITVNGVDYEYISPGLWDSINVGDRVKKLSCEKMHVTSKITNQDTM